MSSTLSTQLLKLKSKLCESSIFPLFKLVISSYDLVDLDLTAVSTTFRFVILSYLDIPYFLGASTSKISLETQLVLLSSHLPF